MLDEATVSLFTLQADICKTLADPKRLMLLHELREGEKSVGQLVANLGLPQGNVSRHLAILRERGVVLTRRQGTSIYYRLADPKIGDACDLVREVLRNQLAQGRALVLGEGPGPVPPGLVGVNPADHHETAVILQPMALLAAPAIEGLVGAGRLVGPAFG